MNTIIKNISDFTTLSASHNLSKEAIFMQKVRHH